MVPALEQVPLVQLHGRFEVQVIVQAEEAADGSVEEARSVNAERAAAADGAAEGTAGAAEDTAGAQAARGTVGAAEAGAGAPAARGTVGAAEDTAGAARGTVGAAQGAARPSLRPGPGSRPGRGAGSSPQVDLRGGLLDRSRAPLPSDVLSRILCDSPVVELVELPDGKLDLGRRTRRISPALRRALNMRDPFCRWPGCYRQACHAHHLEPWSAGGATQLSNLVNLCLYHHRIVHEAGWSLVFRDGRWVALGPQGELRQGVARPPPIPPDARETLRRHAAARGVVVDWDSPMPTHGCDESDFNLLEIGQMLFEALAEDEGRTWPYFDAGPEEEPNHQAG